MDEEGVADVIAADYIGIVETDDPTVIVKLIVIVFDTVCEDVCNFAAGLDESEELCGFGQLILLDGAVYAKKVLQGVGTG